MPAILGDVATKAQTGGLINVMVHGLINARVKANLESYTIGGSAETAGSTLDVGGLIPKGAHIIAILLYVSAAQTSATFDIGDDADADRFAAASTLLQTAGIYVIPGKNYLVGTVDGDDQIVLTTGGATLTAGQLEAAVLFTLD